MLSDFQFFTEHETNYGKGSAYSCITNVLRCLNTKYKQRN